MQTGGVVVDGVRRSFGRVDAVRGASLEALPGRVTGLVGPNGSGKTTLLLMLASLLAPDAGSIRIAGLDPLADPQRVRALLGWMPDALGAWGSLSARETIVITGRLYGLSRTDARARAIVLLEEVGLTPLQHSPARALSRGQKQRLGLARALVHDPRVLLLDEPASGLDPQARVELRILLRRLAAEGRTVLISSHILSELEEVVDDAVFLLAGETVGADRVAAASRRARPWRIRLADAVTTGAPPVARVAAALQRDPSDIEVDRGEIVLRIDSEEDAVQTLRALIADGLPVIEFAAATGRLEHAFLDLDRTREASAPTEGGVA